jgi:hypothetical protein
MGLCLCAGTCLCLTSTAAIMVFANYCVCSYEDMIKKEEARIQEQRQIAEKIEK